MEENAIDGVGPDGENEDIDDDAEAALDAVSAAEAAGVDITALAARVSTLDPAGQQALLSSLLDITEAAGLPVPVVLPTSPVAVAAAAGAEHSAPLATSPAAQGIVPAIREFAVAYDRRGGGDALLSAIAERDANRVRHLLEMGHATGESPLPSATPPMPSLLECVRITLSAGGVATL